MREVTSNITNYYFKVTCPTLHTIQWFIACLCWIIQNIKSFKINVHIKIAIAILVKQITIRLFFKIVQPYHPHTNLGAVTNLIIRNQNNMKAAPIPQWLQPETHQANTRFNWIWQTHQSKQTLSLCFYLTETDICSLFRERRLRRAWRILKHLKCMKDERRGKMWNRFIFY